MLYTNNYKICFRQQLAIAKKINKTVNQNHSTISNLLVNALAHILAYALAQLYFLCGNKIHNEVTYSVL